MKCLSRTPIAELGGAKVKDSTNKSSKLPQMNSSKWHLFFSSRALVHPSPRTWPDTNTLFLINFDRGLFDRDRDESQRLTILRDTHKETAGLLAKLQTEAHVSVPPPPLGLTPPGTPRSLPWNFDSSLPLSLHFFSPELWVTLQTFSEDKSSKK